MLCFGTPDLIYLHKATSLINNDKKIYFLAIAEDFLVVIIAAAIESKSIENLALFCSGSRIESRMFGFKLSIRISGSYNLLF